MEIQIRSTEVSSSSDWSADPDMIEVTLSEALLFKAECAVKYMKENDIHKMTVWWAFAFELYRNTEYFDADELENLQPLTHNGVEYAVFDPEYRIDGCHAEIDSDGFITARLPFKHSNEELTVSVGHIHDLRNQIDGVADNETSAIDEPQSPSTEPAPQASEADSAPGTSAASQSYAVVWGDPMDGYTVAGPCTSQSDANGWARHNVPSGPDWFVVPMTPMM